MSVTFGSVGDIIAVCQIVQSAVIALKDSTGSAAQFQELNRNLARLSSALGEVAKLEKSQRDAIDTTALLATCEQCNSCLKAFLDTIHKYEPSLKKGGSGNVFKDSYRKLRWQSQNEDVARFQREIAELMASLQLLLSTVGINIQVQDNKAIGFRIDELRSLLQTILTTVQTSGEEVIGNKAGGGLAKVEQRRTATEISRGPSRSTPFLRPSNAIDSSFREYNPLSYDEAAEKCKIEVMNLVKECRRTNQSFRDTQFDLQTDMFHGNRLCLQNLVNEGTDLEPGSIATISDIFDNPMFYVDGAGGANAAQAQDGYRWLNCACEAVATVPGLLERILVARDEQVGVYGMVFFRDGEWISVTVDDRLYLTYPPYASDDSVLRKGRKQIKLSEDEYQRSFLSNSRALYFGSSSNSNETWLPILEKGYAKVHGDYASIMNGVIGEGLEDLTGGVTFEISVVDILDKELFWQRSLKLVNREAIFACYQIHTVTSTGAEERITSIFRAVEVEGKRLLLLRDSSDDMDDWKGAWSDGSSQWTPETLAKFDHVFGSGNFWMSYEDFFRQYEYINYTRIFGPEWLLSQQWGAFQIPFDTRDTASVFRITFDSDADQVVLALSQLDARYFRGVQGQYEYSLEFHLEDEDGGVIARTRNTYTLKRSSALEIALSAGTYVVRPRVTATKLPETNTISEVLQSNDPARREKLLQVAFNRDLAYAKVKENPFKQDMREYDGAAQQGIAEWNATCNLGLKVYTMSAESTIEILWEVPKALVTQSEGFEKSGDDLEGQVSTESAIEE